MIDISAIKGMPGVAEIEAELCRRDFFFFFKKFWPVIVPEELVVNWHIPYLCSQLQLIGMRIKNREVNPHDTLINIPPGTSKSTICSQLWPVWLWCIDPTIRIISGSYDINLATRDALKSRDIIRSAEFTTLFHHIIMKEDRNNKRDMENVFGGARYVTSVGAGITGKHAHVLLMDDPLNPKKAASDVEIATTNEWISATLSTRKVDKKMTTTVMVMQRLHERDPSGTWLANKKKKIFHICLPAKVSDLVRPVELKEEYVDGLLDPIRLDHEAINILTADMGTYEAAGQLEQNPAPEEGGHVKKAWIKVIGWEEFLQMQGAKEAVWDTFVDGAYSEDKSGDPTGLDSFCMFNGKLYWKDSIDHWLAFPDAIKAIRSFTLKNGTLQSITGVEPKATGKSIVQTMRNEPGMNVIELPSPTESKEQRLKACLPFIESGKLVLIRGSWNDDVISQVTRFPRARHDEHVDNLTAAIKRHASSGMAFGST